MQEEEHVTVEVVQVVRMPLGGNERDASQPRGVGGVSGLEASCGRRRAVGVANEAVAMRDVAVHCLAAATEHVTGGSLPPAMYPRTAARRGIFFGARHSSL